MKNPPEMVKTVMAAVCVMKGVSPDKILDPSKPGQKVSFDLIINEYTRDKQYKLYLLDT